LSDPAVKIDKVESGKQFRSAELSPDSINEKKRTVDVVFTTGHKGRRSTWFETFNEELEVSEKALKLDRLNAGAPVLDLHRTYSLRNVIGVVERAWIENGTGHATLRFDDGDDAEEVFRKVRNGILRNVSVGYFVHKYEDVSEKGDKIRTYRAVDWEAAEISVVPIGFDPGAQTRSGEGENETVQTEVITRSLVAQDHNDDKGNQGMEPTKEQTRASDEPKVKEAPAVDLDAVRREAGEAAAKAERERVASILTVCRKHSVGDEFAQGLIDRGVSLDAAREAVLDRLAEESEKTSTRSTGRVEAGSFDEGTTLRSGIEAALLYRTGNSEDLPEVGRAFYNLSLADMARACLEKRGVTTTMFSKHELASRAFHSTSDFPEILAGTVNKSLRRAYEAAPQTFGPLVRTVENPDLKEITRAQLGDAPDLLPVKEGEEYKRGTMSEAAERYRIEKFGRVIALTEETIINDDLDAFTRLPAMIGRAAADKESDLIWAIITSNPVMGDGDALFHANHGNTDSAGVISDTTLTTARKLMRLQAGLDGRKLNLFPAFLMVPAALETTALKFLATEIRPTKAGDVNTFKGQLTPIVEPRLDDDSASKWYVAASVNQVDIIERAYLQGRRGVFTEVRNGFDVDGMEIKAKLFVGAKAIDWRGLFRNG
jgi:hypothetical protein